VGLGGKKAFHLWIHRIVIYTKSCDICCGLSDPADGLRCSSLEAARNVYAQRGCVQEEAQKLLRISLEGKTVSPLEREFHVTYI
jgi:hypothetical protein